MKKILVLNGSPKKSASTTMLVTQSFLKGLENSGEYESEILNVSELNIRPCLGCLSCWGRTEGSCVIKDDDALMVKEKVLNADIIMLSFPIFFFGLPGELKSLIDRLLSILNAYHGQEIPENGSYHGFRYDMSGKKLFLIAGCAWSDEKIFEPIKAQFDCIVGNGNYIPIFAPQMTTGAGLGRTRPRYLRFLKKFEVAGEEFAKTGELSEETKKLLDVRYYSPSVYEQLVEDFWQREKAAGAAK